MQFSKARMCLFPPLHPTRVARGMHRNAEGKVGLHVAREMKKSQTTNSKLQEKTRTQLKSILKSQNVLVSPFGGNAEGKGGLHVAREKFKIQNPESRIIHSELYIPN